MHYVGAYGFEQVPEVVARAEQTEDFVGVEAECRQVPEAYTDEARHQHQEGSHFQSAQTRLRGRAVGRGRGGYRGHALSGTGAAGFQRRNRRLTRVGRFNVASEYISAISNTLAAAQAAMVKRSLAHQNQI